MTFQPGNKGGGRRKEKAYLDALMLDLRRTHDGDRTKLQAIAEKHVKMALEGDMQAINSIANRLDGQPAQEQIIDITETKTVIRAPSQNPTTQAWQQSLSTARNMKSSGSLN